MLNINIFPYEVYKTIANQFLMFYIKVFSLLLIWLNKTRKGQDSNEELVVSSWLMSNIYIFFIWFKAKSFKSFLHDFHIKNIFLFQIIQEDNKIKIRASFKSFICNKFKKLLEIFFSYFSHQKNSFIVDETGRLQDPIESRFWEVHL